MKKQNNTKDISKLLEIMERLRDPHGGCPWDQQQTFATIAPYTIEEAYEVADAIERGALAELPEELGDLLLQVVYHSRIAEEQGAFDFGDVVEAICRKMWRRHPHVFGDENVDDAGAQTERWEQMKAAERDEAHGVLGGIPRNLPALTRAAKLGRRAARVGFDWPDMRGVRDKLDEELGELDGALGQGERDAVAAEVGDVLFTVANLCRHLDLDAETCLRQANRRFEQRFERVERCVGGQWQAQTADSLERFWQQAKRGGSRDG